MTPSVATGEMPDVRNSWARNVRAAMVLRGLDLASVAAELNKSRKTLERTLRGERTPSAWETRRLSEILDVPETFLRDGLGPETALDVSPEAMAERLIQVRSLIRSLGAEARWLEGALRLGNSNADRPFDPIRSTR